MRDNAPASTGERSVPEQTSKFDWVAERMAGVAFRCASDAELTMERLTAHASRVLGHAPTELVANRVRSYASLIHPEDRDELHAHLRGLIRDGRDQAGEVEFRIEVGGDARWIQQRTWVVRDSEGLPIGFEGLLFDVSARKRLELAERQRRRQREVVVELATHPATAEGDFESLSVLVTERLAAVAAVERASVWLLSEEPATLELVDLYAQARGEHERGTSLKASEYPDYFAALHRSLLIDADDAMRDPRTREFGRGYLTSHGISSMLDAAIRVAGEVVGVVCLEHVGPPRRWETHEIEFAAEISDQLTLALHNRNRREARARERALQDQLLHGQKMDALGRLAGGVAHDFNNQLMVISASAELLAEMLDNPTAQTLTQEMVKASFRAGELTQQLMSFSRRQPLARHELDLREFVAKLEELLRRVLGRGATLVCTLPKLPVRVSASEGLIQQLLTNLIDNAREAIREDRKGPGRVELSLEIAELREPLVIMGKAVEVGRYALIGVADDGVGMSQELEGRVFEPFFTTKPEGEGAGLGLATAYSITQRLEGTIKVASELGKGSHFLIFLPLLPD